MGKAAFASAILAFILCLSMFALQGTVLAANIPEAAIQTIEQETPQVSIVSSQNQMYNVNEIPLTYSMEGNIVWA